MMAGRQRIGGSKRSFSQFMTVEGLTPSTCAATLCVKRRITRRFPDVLADGKRFLGVPLWFLTLNLYADPWQKGNAAVRINRCDELKLELKLFPVTTRESSSDLVIHVSYFSARFDTDQCSIRTRPSGSARAC